MEKSIIYTYRWLIERGTGAPGYAWKDGYSEDSPNGGVSYPWMTKAECQQDAARRGARALFLRVGGSL
jgi:hypothetical protein